MKYVVPIVLIFSTAIQAQRFRTQITATIGMSSDSVQAFWAHSNKYGQIPTFGNSVLVGVLHTAAYDSTYSRDKKLKPLDWSYGVEGMGLVNQGRMNYVIPQAYLSGRWKNFEAYVGRRKEIFGFVDSTLSSGSYIWSGNALPMPKVQLHTPGYLGKGWIGIKGGIAHGWFTDNGLVQNHFLHQKWLYGRLGKSKFTAYGGINHQVMWGGYSESLKNVGGPNPPTIDGYLAPFPWYSYQYVLIPFLQKFLSPDRSKVPGYDTGLAIGNQLGSVDIGVRLQNKAGVFLIYMQQPYDFARSLYNFNNIEDGLYGLSWKAKSSNKIIHHLILEYLDTRSQGRYRFGKYQESNYGEIDNYFFHGQYQSWSYQNRIIGTPFIFRDAASSFFPTNNRLQMLYAAARGKWHKLHYTLKTAYSKNIGTYGRAIKANQWSSQASTSWLFSPSLQLSLAYSSDFGDLYGERHSVFLRLDKWL